MIHAQDLASPLNLVAQRVANVVPPVVSGRVSRVLGLNMEIDGLQVALGEAIDVYAGNRRLPCEVVALTETGAIAMPLADMTGVAVGDRVLTTGHARTLRVGSDLLGRILDGLGNPIDDGPRLGTRGGDSKAVTVEGTPPHPLRRQHVDQYLPLGVRAIDTLIPCGKGQRMGIFAGSGVGKSSLLSMIARGAQADVNVLALIGERGREVREFIEHDLGPEGLARSIVVVATSDQPALVRMRAAYTATRIAEYFRDQGNDVVLMMDSLTRFAMAQREIGLSAGEPPATRGYPPSVFGEMPKLLERAGAGETGSITGLYTVLVEGDDLQDPIGDTARSILDGHIVLSRKLATAGHFPTIDVLESASRVANRVTTSEQRSLATQLRRLMAAYRDARDLIDIGAYVPGSNPEVDRAIALNEGIDLFLRQDITELTDATYAWQALEAMLNSGGTPALPQGG